MSCLLLFLHQQSLNQSLFMYVLVKLLNGCPQAFTYAVPQQVQHQIARGVIVTVPFQRRFEPAIIESVFDQRPEAATYAIKDIHALEPLLNEPVYKKFVARLAAYYALDSTILYRRLYSFLGQKEIEQVASPVDIAWQAGSELTDEQQTVVDGITPLIQTPSYQACVIHGVTGSGKTEVYLRLMKTAHDAGKATLFLVPEVSLAVRFTRIFKERLHGAVSVFGFHSATSAREKKELWQTLRSSTPAIIVGVHLPTLLPVHQLGLIIIDEEHEIGYQEKKHPKIHTKEAALLRAQLQGIPIVLGSATPSISTLYHVQTRGWKMFTIRKRFAGAFPQIAIVKLASQQQEKRPFFWFSKQLEMAIAQRLSKREQVIIFINRRGYSFFMQCGGCGFIFKCVNCSVSLTFHEEGRLCCHYCGFSQAPAEHCPTCSGKKFLKKGIGTQQVVSLLERLFPQARVGRADLDATVNKKKWEATLNSFANQELDILVGTQTITKGYHFPRVTLVGILWADLHLSIPTYNAGETTLQQLIQVAGRAGRQHPESLVIVQTMLEHALLSYVDEVKYLEFYKAELAQRAEMNYPPLTRLAEIELRHEAEHVVDRESLACTRWLQSRNEQGTVRVLGPARPPVHKIKNIHVRKIYLKGDDIRELTELYKQIRVMGLSSSCFFTPNPLSF